MRCVPHDLAGVGKVALRGDQEVAAAMRATAQRTILNTPEEYGAVFLDRRATVALAEIAPPNPGSSH